MNAREEAQDLAANPLPLALPIGVNQEDLLGHYLNLEEEILTLRERIEQREEEKAAVLLYALANNIREDNRARIEETPGRKTRTLNILRFREVFPEEYSIACDIERKDKMDALDHIGEKVNLTLVDRLIKKAALAAAPGVITVTEGPATIRVVLK